MEFNRQFRFDLREASELIRDESTYGLVLITILLEAYGEQLFEVDSIELYLEIEEDFRAIMSEAGENRVQACLISMMSDDFYTDPLILRAVAMALYEGSLGDLVNGVLEPVEVPEVLWAVYEVGLLRDDDAEFSQSTKKWLEELMESTAEELDLESEDEVLPYYVRALEPEKAELKRQLDLLGVDKTIIDEL